MVEMNDEIKALLGFSIIILILGGTIVNYLSASQEHLDLQTERLRVSENMEECRRTGVFTTYRECFNEKEECLYEVSDEYYEKISCDPITRYKEGKSND